MRLKYSKLKTFILSTLFVSSFSHAKVDVDALKTELLPKGTKVGFVAKNLSTNQIIADYNSDDFMLPASTQKMFTALASKLTLAKNFYFQTALLTKGEITNGVLNGNLVARFSGDPHLSSDDLFQLFAQLKKRGVNEVQGNLILDTSIFASHDRAPGWVWNDLTMCFNAPPAAVNIDNNCFSATIDSNQPVGQQVKVKVPSAYPVQFFSKAYVAKPSEAAYCQFDIEVQDNDRYFLKGCTTNKRQPYTLRFAVQDPTTYGASVLKADLKRAGIKFNGKVHVATQLQTGKLLAEHHSPELPELLKKMLKKSDNQIADSLFRTMAYQKHQHPASFALGRKTLRETLLNKANIDIQHSVITDGSGLSRYNQVSANTMLQALEYINQNEQTLNLIDSLPVAGVDGTLSSRGSFNKAPLTKNLKAKTGTLDGVYNLAGFMKNAKGETIAFVQFVNGYETGDLDKLPRKSSLHKFEDRVYNAIYKD